MTAIDEIREKLAAKHPELSYEVEDHRICVSAPTPNGFDVSLTEGDGQYVVAFDAWHEHFDSKQTALNCFASGFSDLYRLKVSLRGDYPYKWTLEYLDDGTWTEVSTTGLIFFPFWRKRRVEYLSNRIGP